MQAIYTQASDNQTLTKDTQEWNTPNQDMDLSPEFIDSKLDFILSEPRSYLRSKKPLKTKTQQKRMHRTKQFQQNPDTKKAVKSPTKVLVGSTKTSTTLPLSRIQRQSKYLQQLDVPRCCGSLPIAHLRSG